MLHSSSLKNDARRRQLKGHFNSEFVWPLPATLLIMPPNGPKMEFAAGGAPWHIGLSLGRNGSVVAQFPAFPAPKNLRHNWDFLFYSGLVRRNHRLAPCRRRT